MTGAWVRPLLVPHLYIMRSEAMDGNSCVRLKKREDRGVGDIAVEVGDLVCFKRNGNWIACRVYKVGVTPVNEDGEIVQRGWITARTRSSKARKEGREYFFDADELPRLCWLLRPSDSPKDLAAVEAAYAPLPSRGAASAAAYSPPAPMNDDAARAALDAAKDDASGVPSAPIMRPADDCTEAQFAAYYIAVTGKPLGAMALIDTLAWHRLGWDVFSPEYEQARAEDELVEAGEWPINAA